MTSLTIDHGLSVILPVFAACGSVDDCELKYAPYGQPSQQALRYWHAERPSCAWVRLAERPGMMRRCGPKILLALSAISCSPQLRGIAGRNCPSGSCGIPS